MNTLTHLFKDPISGLTHFLGAILGLFGLIYLVVLSNGAAATTIASVSIYGISMVLLYSASSAYHLLKISPKNMVRLRRLDHAMVPVFIAGTYTPFCLLALKGPIGYAILILVWTLAVAGLFKSLYWVHAPRWVTAGLFVLMGWIIVTAVYPLAKAVTPTAFWLILGGGMLYSVGALVYAKKWPDPWPKVFGFHEVWHLFVLGGSACHYWAVLSLV